MLYIKKSNFILKVSITNYDFFSPKLKKMIEKISIESLKIIMYTIH